MTSRLRTLAISRYGHLCRFFAKFLTADDVSLNRASFLYDNAIISQELQMNAKIHSRTFKTLDSSEFVLVTIPGRQRW